MSVWRTLLCLLCLSYFLMEVQGYTLPPFVDLGNGTLAAPVWGDVTGTIAIICKHGYAHHPKNISLCLPVCERGCSHGYCKSPGVCGCLENRIELFGECRATCAVDGTCAHGECVGGMCTNCMPGYKTVSSGLYCEPRCERVQCDFKTQICTAPDTCSCRPEYKWQYNRCVPECERDCLHGECVAPGKCVCYNGRTTKDGLCQANCWMDCTNGICVRENVCECLEGFSLALPSLKCTEKCEGCDYGKCIAPNQCQCNDGYRWSKSKRRCKPKCNDCDGWGMVCVSPNSCQCSSEFYAARRFPRLKCMSKPGFTKIFRYRLFH